MSLPNIFLSARQEIFERADFLFRKSVFKVDGPLGMDDAPIMATACPFLRYVHHCKVKHFQQTVICRKYGLGFRHLAELAVKAFYGIGGIDKPPITTTKSPAKPGGG